MEEIVKLSPPGFDSVMVCAALVVLRSWAVKDSVVALRAADAGLDAAMPLREILCGVPTTESLKSKVALLVPTAVGVNVMLTAQLAPAAKEDPQVVEI